MFFFLQKKSIESIIIIKDYTYTCLIRKIAFSFANVYRVRIPDKQVTFNRFCDGHFDGKCGSDYSNQSSFFFRNSRSWHYKHLYVTSHGNKLGIVANHINLNTN